MGYSNAAYVTHFLSAYAQQTESKSLRQAAGTQASLANSQADSMVFTSGQNAIRAQRNRNARMAGARVDAAASNLADDGSARVRETDLATRLEDEITNSTNAALQQAEAARRQGLFNAWDTRNQAKQAKYRAIGSAMQGAASLSSEIINSMRDNPYV